MGVVDIKINHVETPEEIAMALERAEQALGPSRVRYAHPDCGFWMLKRSVADRKIAALVKGQGFVSGAMVKAGGSKDPPLQRGGAGRSWGGERPARLCRAGSSDPPDCVDRVFRPGRCVGAGLDGPN